MKRIEIRFYKTKDGKTPFLDWLYALRDKPAIGRIKTRLKQIELGNMGDYKGAGGIVEIRIKAKGPGYRLYCGMDGETLIIMLAGGNKSSQQKDISKAKDYWDDYNTERT